MKPTLEADLRNLLGQVAEIVRPYDSRAEAFDALLKCAKRYVLWQEDVRAECHLLTCTDDLHSEAGRGACSCGRCCECEARAAIALAERS